VNLIGNAIKFTEFGEVIVAAKLEAKDDQTQVLRCTITDTGIGMDDELMARLFMPFTQGESALTRKHGGTGLGLAISKKLAELMGGDIRVETAPGAGSVFFFHLPAASQADAARAAG
jgi:signal transduction histidine kinase